jgi:hypothetical protein
MTVRIHGDSGKFEMKGDEPRKSRVITLTDTAWERLKASASARGMSRSDLIETAALKGQWSESSDHARDKVLEEIQDALDELLEDEDVTRKGKDRGTVKRTIAALLDILG